MIFIFIGACAYVLGSIPFGYLAGCAAGIDVRQHGSGNIGATNVLRVLGKKYGYAVFAADALKGLGAVRIALWLAREHAASTSAAAIIAAICAVLGHSYPVWLRFHGGKGVATAAGACAGLLPQATLLVGIVWLLAFGVFRYVSLASMLAAIALPFAVWLVSPKGSSDRLWLLLFAAALAVIIVLRHRGNIARLLRGTEPRFVRK